MRSAGNLDASSKWDDAAKLPTLTVFVPVYNEEEACLKILDNIEKVELFFPNFNVVISDNGSTDETVAKIKAFPKRLQSKIKILQNPKNVGFSENLCNVVRAANSGFIMLLGADDNLRCEGVYSLQKLLISKPDVDLVIGNWSYTSNTCKHLVSAPFVSFESATLDDYFQKTFNIPNSITQYTCNVKILKSIGSFARFQSPHLSLFFSAFPGQVIYMGYPPLFEVEYETKTGWRSSNLSVMKTHLTFAKEIFFLSYASCKKNNLSSKKLYEINKHTFKACKAIIRGSAFGAWGTRKTDGWLRTGIMFLTMKLHLQCIYVFYRCKQILI